MRSIASGSSVARWRRRPGSSRVMCISRSTWLACVVRDQQSRRVAPAVEGGHDSATNVHDHERRYVNSTRPRVTRRVIGAHQVVGEMRVQALHAPTRAADAATGLRRGRGARWRASRRRAYASCARAQLVGVHERLRSGGPRPRSRGDSPASCNLGIDQPVQGGHRRAVAQVRLVFDHDRPTVSRRTTTANRPAEWPSESDSTMA